MIYRIRFSSIKNKWLRRPVMVLAFLPMMVCNWTFVVFAIAAAAPGLFWRSTLTICNGFSRVWNGERVEDEV